MAPLRVFKGKQFNRWASGEAIDDADLCQAAAEAFSGQVDADLGGYLFKQRIARRDSGKSGGYRTILGFRKSDSSRIFFLFGFPKNARANLTSRERAALSANATSLVSATDAQIDALKIRGTLVEMECGQ